VPPLSLRAAGLLAAALLPAGCAAPPSASMPAAPTSHSSSYAGVVERICRGYAERQTALPADLMYPQCMYARGYIVPGFMPSPNSPGYQGELPGPYTHSGGGP
jgi:hypothetical protein